MTDRSGSPSLRILSAALLMLLPFLGCGGGPPTGPGDGDENLPAAPVLVSPAAGAQLQTDTPTFSVQNARGFNTSAATYTFQVLTRSGALEIATTTVPAGRGTTSATFPTAMPRGMSLTWKVRATTAGRESVSSVSTFTTVPVECPSVRGAYAKSVVEWFLPACSLAHNAYNDPQEVLGPPDAGRTFAGGPFFGFMSLGEKGHVTVDMGGCFVDGPGDDLRIYQSVSTEPVTVFVSGLPDGPFIKIGDRESCGVRTGGGIFSGHCQFDLATGEVTEARFVRVEDGEHYPCEQGQTDSEGADIDAVEMINRK
jgi:hypothetical protein